MQNLPLLVTPNTPPKQTVTTAASDAKSIEQNGDSFKQVLTRQVESNSKDKQPVQDNTQQSHAQAQQTQSNSVLVENYNVDAVNPETMIEMVDKGNALTGAELKQAKSAKKIDLTEDAQEKNTTDETIAMPPAMLIQQIVNIGAAPKESATEGSTTTLPTDVAITEVSAQKSKAIDFGVPMAKGQKMVLQEDNGAIATDKKLTETNLQVVAKDEKVIKGEQGFAAKLADSAAVLHDQWQGRLEQIAPNKVATEPPVSLVPAAVTATQALMQSGAVQMQSGSSNVIDAYPGKAGWDQAISQKVVWMVGATEQSATLTLNPPDLGPLQVVINVNNEKADTTFISENPEVRKALEDGIPALRDLMNQAGVQLGQANVSTGSQQQEFQHAEKARAIAQSKNMGTSRETEPQVTSAIARVKNGLVDTFA